MKHKIPQFVVPLFQEAETKEERDEVIADLKRFKEDKYTQALIAYLSKLERELILEDEKIFPTKFETNSRRQQRYGRRKQIRHVVNDLSQESL